LSVSRCLGPATAGLKGVPRPQWRTYIDTLPEACPHADCTGTQGCRARVAEYFRVQWHCQANLEAAAGRKPGDSGGLRGQG
jgi:hypothetical protein